MLCGAHIMGKQGYCMVRVKSKLAREDSKLMKKYFEKGRERNSETTLDGVYVDSKPVTRAELDNIFVLSNFVRDALVEEISNGVVSEAEREQGEVSKTSGSR